ncbi:HD domain-containing protein [Streptomyces africanus]|uniref:HD domain-containing protein n=1 Tax=Streptomyces africanus TaxID=231024 RepID=UPI00244B45C9|nr:caspase family protein [Streptomyces africanus]
MKPGQAEAPGAGRRRALVVGVGRTPALERDEHLARRFPALDSAVEDVELVSRALRQSHYEVRPLLDPGGFQLLGALQEFFDECSPGDTAFLYVSCHGTTVGKREHLLPADVQPGRMDPAGGRSLLDRTLIAADPEGLLDGLPAGVTTVVCLDLCRTEEPTPLAEQSRRTVLSAAEDVYWLYSCSRGERSYADPQDGSWFGRALAKALAPTTQPTTFADLVRYTRTAVRRTASDAGVMPPAVDRYVPHGLDADGPGPVLCEGAQEAYRWTTMIEQSSLWEYTSGTAAVHERVKKRLGELVEHIVDSLSTEGAHRDDPWTDPTYPVRVVDRTETLVKRARLEGRDLLSPAETAALLAAPVVQEGVVAIALEELRRTMPEGMDVKSAADDALEGHDRLVRDAAHDVARAHSQVRRTVATLRRRGLKEQTAAADHWLRHRFITDWDLLWERTGDYPAVDTILDLLVSAILDAAADPTGTPVREATRLTIDGQVRQVLGHLTVHPSTSPRINDARGGDDWSTYPPVPGNQWRASDLARLLWTAGLQAADPRRMSSVLVDHLGAHEPLDPDDVVAALSADFGYDVTLLGERDDDPYQLTVRFACPHPALHVAVEELAARTNATVSLLHQECQKARTTPPALLRGFPERVTTDQLVPVAERYKQPLERFRLAEDEIRPLLMGTQLYGDPMLAVRELYQNALDACRYRDMRRQYGAVQGRPGPDWQPRITFTQGWDADGRPYIECTDNGSGMNRAKLTSMFARAGKRYEQDPEFVQERRNWRRAELGEMPLNSRFGIGVFSYFMLAEEVVVWTSPVDHYGRALQLEPLRADIQSGSGLLRIGQDPHVALDGGTRVRLYLGEDSTVPPSLVDTLESFLWVADFEVEARELTKDDTRTVVRHRRWEPGALMPPTPKPWYGDAVQGARDIWLVQGPGGWLLDGVVIKDAPESYGHIVNLRERHRPEPSVDRNSLISYDEEAVTSELLDAAPRAAARWREVLLQWLWDLAEKSPRLAFVVLDSLPDNTAAIIFPTAGIRHQTLPRSIPLATAGCLPMDESNEDVRGPWRGLLGEYQSALAKQWQKARLALHQEGKTFLPPGYPVPASMDAILFPKDSAPRGWETVLRAAHLTHTPSGEPLKALRRYAILGAQVPAATEIRGLRTARPTKKLVELSRMWRSMQRARTLHKPALYAPLLLIAARYRLRLADAVALLEELRTWQFELPPPPVLDADLAAEVPTRGDAALLVSKELNEERHLWPGELGVVDLLTRAEPGVPVSDLAERVRRFEPLGFSLREEPSPAAVAHGPLDAMERPLFGGAMSVHRDRTLRRGDDLRMASLLVLAAELQTPPSEVAARVNALTPVTGIRADEPPAEVADWIPSSLAAEVLSAIRRRGAGVSPWEFIRVITRRASRTPSLSPRSDIDLDEIDKLLRRLNTAGLLAPGFEDRIEETVRQLEVWDHPLTRGHTIAASGRHLDEQGVTPPVLVQLSASERRPIGDIVQRLTGQDQILPVSVTRPDPAVLDLQATSQDVTALLRHSSSGFLPDLRLSRLLHHAYGMRRTLAASLEHLARFVPLGAPPPPCAPDSPEFAAVRDHTPDLFDLAAFSPGLLGIGDESCVLGPLELVRTAGRFDWTLGTTYDRYAPFACLGLDVTVGRPEVEVADRVPDWQDLIILTEQLTGRAPALAGVVSEDHITLSAEETDLPESQVRERLARYADLFSLELSAEAPHLEGTAE